MIYASAYPIWHTFEIPAGASISYDISLGGEDIYAGKILPYDTKPTTIRVDLSEILREYLEPFYEEITFSDLFVASVPVSDSVGTIRTFTVSSEYNLAKDGQEQDEVSYTVAYNNNTDYISELDERNTINNPITLDADHRQYLFLCGYDSAGRENTYRYRINGGSWAGEQKITSQLYQLYGVRLGALARQLLPGDRVELQHVQTGKSHVYTIASPCGNRFALYYVNKSGALDSLLCSGRYVESLSAKQTDSKLYNDRGSRMDWETKRIHQEISRQFELNTRFLSDEESDRIDELIYSPKVWIHDLDKDTMTSCLISDSSCTKRRYSNDSIFSYTLNVTESQKYIRL